MLRWFRRRLTAVAVLLVAATTALGGTSALPHGDDCHDECAPLAVAHDASAHRVGAPSASPEAPEHCLVCHWVRSFRPSPENRVTSSPAVESGLTIRWTELAVTSGARFAQPPLRSPPSASLS